MHSTTAPPDRLGPHRRDAGRDRWLPLTAAAAVLTVLVAPAVVACSADRQSTENLAAGRGADKVTYLTAFGTPGREGFVFLGKDKGYFSENQIDLEVVGGAAGDKNFQMIVAGQAQFAAVDYTGVAMLAGNHRLGAGKDQLGDFKIVAALQPTTLIALMAKTNRGIVTPRDLAGKRLGIASGAVPEKLWPGYAKLAGIDASHTKIVNFAPPQLPAMLAGDKVDAVGIFVTGKPGVAQAVRPSQVTVLPYGDYMNDLYGNVLIARSDLIERDPGLVRRFTAALIKSLTYSVQNDQTAAECGKATHKAAPATDKDTATEEIKEMRNWVKVGPANEPIGSLDPARVRKGLSLLRSLGLIADSDIDPASFVDFTITSTPKPVDRRRSTR
ncbi:ABC transporter substrate-binding protein [Rhizomonospora bruguierae]|uniref:ABC transporter substrate-binding protein n=1 Tax=Rhizomonospora bruguierae TaxID=1581705 RepID=UPI001BCCE6FC|nr:ABC transporter substrate-binding protein [Micromonospora sp. NBRC 107566]